MSRLGDPGTPVAGRWARLAAPGGMETPGLGSSRAAGRRPSRPAWLAPAFAAIAERWGGGPPLCYNAAKPRPATAAPALAARVGSPRAGAPRGSLAGGS